MTLLAATGAAVPYLIDGYNLMYAVGAAPPPGGPRAAFDAARGRFLDWLADCPAVRPGTEALRVVFDAQNSPRDLGTSTHRGLLVTYSFRQTADDLIEAFVAVEPRPPTLRVVSNDGRVQTAARRRGCKAVTCEQFTDWLREPPAAPSQPVSGDGKPPPMTPAELADLLRAFGPK